MISDFDNLRISIIGTIEYVSPKEIKVKLDIDAPKNMSINNGIPQLFPKVNGYVLIPNGSGLLIGIISWIGIEYSQYPKRNGFKDFDLIDLPFPLRKMSIKPLGILKEDEDSYKVERGVYNYPSIGDHVILPNQNQLRALVENKGENSNILIGTSSQAGNAPIYVNPNKIFGRHIAILGNTGSGKSCSVAGLIRWSLETAKSTITTNQKINSRFIILDPNGEYGESFDDITSVKKYQVKLNANSDKFEQLKLPSWMWNSYEWSSIGMASGKTQRPILKRALREIKGSMEENNTDDIKVKNYLASVLIRIQNFENLGSTGLTLNKYKYDFGEALKTIMNSLVILKEKLNEEKQKKLDEIIITINSVILKRQNGQYWKNFETEDIIKLKENILNVEPIFGEIKPYLGPDEDTPLFFNNNDFINHIEYLSIENNIQQFMDIFIMRVKSIITDKRISSVIETKDKDEVTLEKWLDNYIGTNEKGGGIVVIDLSLIPSEILYVVVAVLSRIIFEAHQRYRAKNGNVLPSTLVIEEAHNFISRYNENDEEITQKKLCTQIFEKIAKEGRKFGLGLVVSSQRPSELSQTVLSQCNTFLLHRIVNDRDQEMVKKLVPDSMESLLDELPILPTRKAILLGWAAPIPLIVDMKFLKENHRPKSNDPEFWDVWIGNKQRKINWSDIADEWQNTVRSIEKIIINIEEVTVREDQKEFRCASIDINYDDGSIFSDPRFNKTNFKNQEEAKEAIAKEFNVVLEQILIKKNLDRE